MGRDAQVAMGMRECPFCGSNCVFPWQSPEDYDLWVVICPDCDAEGPEANNELKAVSLWNRRP
jgi:Lar family restriction alleviation protein